MPIAAVPALRALVIIGRWKSWYGRDGFDEQIFGADEQVLGRGLSDKEEFGPKMWER